MKDETKIKSVSEFLNTIYKRIDLTNEDESFQIRWFRGESSIRWDTPLVPKIYRVLAHTIKSTRDDLFDSRNLRELEKNLNSDFLRQALPHIIEKGFENNGWNRYCLMQHYKIKTRMLDWTENALVALFFAVEDQAFSSDDAKVWILKPFLLNHFAINTLLKSDNFFMIIPHCSESDKPEKLLDKNGKILIDELTRRYLRMDFNQDEKGSLTNIYHPLAVYPFYLDQRMAAQKTCFTIFGNKINGLLSADKKDVFLDSILIDGKEKLKIMNELALAGIDHYSIFPDLDGLGISLNLKYKRILDDNRESLFHFLKKIQKK
jgi:hypothetical protein